MARREGPGVRPRPQPPVTLEPPNPELVLGPPCPMCGLQMEPYDREPRLWACYLDDLTWNVYTKMARAIRRG